ncbi:hypothetical protein FACS1894170_05510 [Planctomycetales bacterium]|nr:hypothetical protein FACS1894170_05510 [Planctomycetales bacterium]
MKPISCILVALLLFFAGCDLAAPQGKIQSEKEQQAAAKAATVKPEPEKIAPEEVQQIEEKPKPADGQKTDEQDADDKPKKKKKVVKKAEVGDGAKGHYGQAGGNKLSDVITVPVGAKFRAQERITFEIQMVHGLTAYRAEHDGKGPATDEEFKKAILEPAQIKLPQLRPGQEYWWDPDADDGKGDLMIVEQEKK